MIPIQHPLLKKFLKCIFHGATKSYIAKNLQQKGIPTPLKYKETTCSYKNPNSRKNYIWNTASISNILRDQIYIGDLVQHKYAKLNYKSKKTVNIDKNSYKKLSLIATGGLTNIIIPHTRNKFVYDENLTLFGAALLFQRNTKI